MSSRVAQGQADVVEAFEQAVPGEVVERERRLDARRRARSRVRRSTSMVISRAGSASTAASSASPTSASTWTGTSPALVAVVAEDVAEAGRDHGLEAVVGAGPTPRAPATSRCRSWARPPGWWRRRTRGWLSTKSAVVAPLGEQALAEAGALDPLEPVAGDDLVGVDVGAVERHGGAGDDANGFHGRPLRLQEVGGAGEVAGDGGGGGDGGGDQVGAAAAALAALEVAVGRGRAPLAGRQLVGVHGQAHRAARLPPLEAGGGEHPVEALGLGLRLHQAASRARPGPACPASHVAARRGRPAAARRSSMRALVHEPMNTVSTAMSAHRRARGQAHVGQGPGRRPRGAAGRRSCRGRARAPSIGTTWPGLVPQVTWGASRGGVERHLLVERWRRRRWRSDRQSSSAALPCRRRWGAWGGPRGRRTSCRRGRSCRPGRPPRSTCCRPSSGPPSTAPGWPSPRYSMTWPMPPPVPMRADDGEDDVLGGDARPAASPSTVTAMVLGGAGAASGWPARARPRWCRCRRPARRRRRGSRCGCRRRRSSCPAGSGPARGR